MKFTEDQLIGYMGRCIELALQTEGYIKRPHVGAIVLSENGRIIGEGRKRHINGTKYSILHAERVALNEAEGEEPFCLVTTLEPCYRSDKQLLSSCAELIVNRGIKSVVFGTIDISTVVNSCVGINYLRKHGIETIVFNTYKKDILRNLRLDKYNLDNKRGF
ncbi:hypothetical protein J4440_00730 [Candidatus Woesearchaeota archaeon]|nr:hypothetical protein [Candidatus Woesearchaeota archaeon]